MQAGTRRYSLPSTQYLIHQIKQGQIFSFEEVSEKEESVGELKRLNSLVMNTLAERSGVPLQDLLKLTKKTDHWVDAEGAKNFGPHGLIDEIISSLPIK